MHAHRTAALIASGDELAIGQARDTNSAEVAAALLDAGIQPVEHAVLPDDLDALAATLARLAARVEVVVMTGGLGPTADDLTREALARVLGEPLVEDAAALAALEAFFAGRGRAMPPLNRVQALRPASARCLPNPHGTAPGLHAVVRTGKGGGDGTGHDAGRGGHGHACDVFCLPGPPREMRPMLRDHLLPGLRPARRILTRVIPTCGLGESVVAQRLGEMMRRNRNPLVGTTASGGIVSCRLRWEGAPAAAAGEAALDRDEAEIRRLLGSIVIGSSSGAEAPTLASAVLDLLRRDGRTLAAAESCTGGLLGGALTAVPGASDVYLGGWVAYSNAMKSTHLGVDPAIIEQNGAVSAECAAAMALGVIERSTATDAISITGIAGPGGGSTAKPVGTVWIGLASRIAGPRASAPARVETRGFLFGEDRATIRERSVVSALNLLRLRRLDAGDDPLLWEKR